MAIKRILFPTDFSKYSEKAREYVLYLAGQLKSEVYILHAIVPLEYDEKEVDEEIDDFYKELKTVLEEKMAKEKLHFDSIGIVVHTKLKIGPRLKVINNFAKEHNIDLIIIGSHGIKNDEGDISLGTTSHKVMLTSPCPILVVRRDD